MNKQRRKSLYSISAQLSDCLSAIEDICADEQYSLENLPESLQDSQRAESMQDAIDAMDEATSSIQDAIDSIEKAAE